MVKIDTSIMGSQSLLGTAFLIAIVALILVAFFLIVLAKPKAAKLPALELIVKGVVSGQYRGVVASYSISRCATCASFIEGDTNGGGIANITSYLLIPDTNYTYHVTQLYAGIDYNSSSGNNTYKVIGKTPNSSIGTFEYTGNNQSVLVLLR